MTLQLTPRPDFDFDRTPKIVGPGRYDLASEQTPRYQGYAPFGTQTSRDICSALARDLQNQGDQQFEDMLGSTSEKSQQSSLQKSQGPSQPQQNKPSSVFKSKTKRLYEIQVEQNRSVTPGPGTYFKGCIDSETNKKRKLFHAFQKRYSTPPTFPKRKTCEFTGIGVDTVGPYEYNAEKIAKRQPVIDFSKIRPKKTFFEEIRSLTPGPGTYELSKNILKTEPIKTGLSSFVSITQRDFPTAEMKKNPGPGTYNIQKAQQKKNNSDKDEKFDFGQKEERRDQ